MTKQQADEGIGALVGALLASYGEYPEIVKIEAAHRINRNSVLDVLDKLQRLVFAGFFGAQPIKRDSIEYYVGELVEYVLYTLQKQIKRALRSLEPGGENPEAAARRIAFAFMGRLPEVRRILAADVTAAYDGDPAAFSRDEIILSYPGIYADMVYRLAHELDKLGVPFIPRMMTEYAHSRTGVDIHPGATIGHHFFIDHGTGIVIGETTVIGNYVKIYQGVTLGALSTRGGQFLSGVKRHPTIEDHVTIYSGASILGGGTVIGEGVVIGSNAFITKSVPEKTRVSVKDPELQFMQQGGRVEFVQDFVI
ncbi:MAG: serine acetyltransferase [Desulfovibrio sp.]|jgi:serine O-acetyltransferase|nr:serine acetyltransferase [Desulfovibrio sp.]